jgi:5-formyltetrahydrofolate cyclo-ligase
MNDIIIQKKLLRKEISKLKDLIPFEEKLIRSQKIFDEVENHDYFKKAETIMVYWSLQDEVQTHDFILKWNGIKKIILPVVMENGLELRVFTGLERMVPSGKLNIPEPQGEPFRKLDDIDLIIVPGMVFDRANNRMGRGKAYYDNFLPLVKNAYKVGVCFDFQLIDAIPVSEHDVKMDLVITGARRSR